jgi:hypothetical protein
MRLQPPEKVTKDQVTFDVSEIEPFLQGTPLDMKPWPNAMVNLPDGKVMFIRAAKKEEVPLMLPYLRRVMDIDYDFYDIVGVRVYAELLGWYRNRHEDVNISHHTMTFIRRGRIGAVMYYCKAYYAFEVLGNKEFWSTFESYNGWRLGFQTVQPSYPWPQYQHELGGARVFYVTREHWDKSVKNYVRQMIGTDLVFDNIPGELVKANEVMRVPEEVAV